MNPWFDHQTASVVSGILGAAIGIWGGTVVGGFSWLYIRKGWKKFTCFLYLFTIAAGLVLAGVGIAGLIVGQPFYVWWPFLLCCGITVIVIGSLFPVIMRRFKEREQQLMRIKDL